MRVRHGSAQGFSLFELVIVMGILLIVTGVVITGFVNGLRVESRERAMANRDIRIKRAIELMTLELAQAGVTPDILELNDSSGVRIESDIGSGTTRIRLQGKLRGYYPGRPLVLGLPEGEPTLSERLPIARVDSDNRTLELAMPTQLNHKVNPALPDEANGAITSPMLPMPFGILNPPPLASPSPLALSALAKTVTNIGFVGDILGNGTIQYVEYRFSNNRLLRSITPIDSPVQQPFHTLLDNVTQLSFTINYAGLAIPLPIAVIISITARSSGAEARVAGGASDANTTYTPVTFSTQVTPRGTAAAAFIWGKQGENSLRQMMPECPGSAKRAPLPPCDWQGVEWWRNVASFSAQLP